MWTLIALVRILLVILIFFIGYFLSFLVGVMSENVFSIIARTWCRSVLLIIGVRCTYEGSASDDAVLMVSNHISWADILVIGARWPYVFLARHDLASWPFIGGIAKRSGTLFIERGYGAALAKQQVFAILGKKQSVFIFPEGRTSIGVEVMKFHPRIFQAAIDADVAVQPVGLFYFDHYHQRSDGSRITYALDRNFLYSVWQTLAGPPTYAIVAVYPVIMGVSDRQKLATLSQQIVTEFVESEKLKS